MKKWIVLVLVLASLAGAEEYARPYLPFADKQGKSLKDMKEVRKSYRNKAYSYKFKSNEGRSFLGDEYLFNRKININVLDSFLDLGVSYYWGANIEPHPYILYSALISDIGIIGTVTGITYKTLSDSNMFGTYYKVKIDSVAWDKGYLGAKPEFIYVATLSGQQCDLDGDFGYALNDRILLMAQIPDEYYESNIKNKINYLFVTRYAFDITKSTVISASPGQDNLNEFKDKFKINTIYDLLEKTHKIHKLNDAKNFFNRKYE